MARLMLSVGLLLTFCAGLKGQPAPGYLITTIAGRGTSGFSGDAGPAISAEFDDLLGLARDGAGNIYVADFHNSRVRKVTPQGIASTVAGNGNFGFSGDEGPA